MAADYVGAIGEAGGMLVIGGAQQQRGGIDGSGADYHDVASVAFDRAMALDHNCFYFPAGFAGFQFRNMRVGQQLHVGMLQRGIDGANLRVGLGVNQARKTIACAALDAGTFARIIFIEHDAERHGKRIEAPGFEVFVQMLNALFVGHSRIRIRRA